MATRSQINAVLQNHRDQIAVLQEDYRALNQKYRHIKRGDYHAVVRADEYVRPDGGIGYVIFLFADEGADSYIRTIIIHQGGVDVGSWELVFDTSVWSN